MSYNWAGAEKYFEKEKGWSDLDRRLFLAALAIREPYRFGRLVGVAEANAENNKQAELIRGFDKFAGKAGGK